MNDITPKKKTTQNVPTTLLLLNMKSRTSLRSTVKYTINGLCINNSVTKENYLLARETRI